jgi:hypothetical protein
MAKQVVMGAMMQCSFGVAHSLGERCNYCSEKALVNLICL